MALTDVRPYFRARMDALGHKEWTDGFNTENIPSNILDRSYHLSNGSIASEASSHIGHEFLYPVTIKLFLKGYRDPKQGIDDAVGYGENILNEVLKSSNRLGTTIKDVIPQGMEILPLNESNDNAIILQVDFIARVILCFT